MPARSSVIVSPSSSSTRRNTPCVDGCCGPMLTTTRSSLVAPISVTSESQSPPVTEKTVPSVVSREDAYGSCIVLIGMTCAHWEVALSRPCTQLGFHRVDNLFVADAHASHLASRCG